jgi:integrase
MLTDSFLRSAGAPAHGRAEFSDLRCPGLVLRITTNGIKSWSYRYRDKAAGRIARATIGQYPAIGLAAARARANAMRQEVAEGSNPADRKRRSHSSAGSFGGLAARYLAEHARRHKRSHEADERNLRKHVLPRWQHRPYASIKRADVIELVEGLVAEGKDTLANRVQALVSSIFSFAMDADLIEHNPCARLRKRGVENVGRRVLSDAEIKLLWSNAAEPPRARQLLLGLRLALLTGARVGEVTGLCRAELDGVADAARATWTIPGTRTKNGRDHRIPLSALARDVVLDLLGLIAPSDQYLFPTPSQRRRGPMKSTSMSRAMRYLGSRLQGDDDAIRTWRAEPPSPHDLRRTVGTRLAELRVPKEVRDRVLNHVVGDVGNRHYNLHDYIDEKREALARWARMVAAIAAGARP